MQKAIISEKIVFRFILFLCEKRNVRVIERVRF